MPRKYLTRSALATGMTLARFETAEQVVKKLREKLNDLTEMEKQRDATITDGDDSEHVLTIEGCRLRWETEVVECLANIGQIVWRSENEPEGVKARVAELESEEEKRKFQVTEAISDLKGEFGKFSAEFQKEQNAKWVERELNLRSEIEAKYAQELKELKLKIRVITEYETKQEERLSDAEERTILMYEDREHEAIEISQLKEKIETKIDSSIKELDRTVEDLKLKVDKIDAFSENNPKSPGINGTAPMGQGKIKMRPPTFKVEQAGGPIRFITELNHYLKAVKPDVKEMTYIISRALEGTARDWWCLIESEVVDFESFEKLFRERFWNLSTQDAVRRKIEFGKYEAVGKTSRAEYATKMFTLARDLETNYTDAEIIRKLSTHFEREIRFAIRGQQVKERGKLIELLQDYDNESQPRTREYGVNQNARSENAKNDQDSEATVEKYSNSQPKRNEYRKYNSNFTNNQKNPTSQENRDEQSSNKGAIPKGTTANNPKKPMIQSIEVSEVESQKKRRELATTSGNAQQL